uniref:THAP-type domain-containing protein n=1 Tax=Oryzias latipes TaxID=8090 RepID=A0A3P9LCV3_ORYLA
MTYFPSSKYNSLLSFHTFPSDAEIRRKWLVAIRRDKFTVTPHTRVCSRHFNKDDVREPLSETGRRLLNKGAVPALFEWNNFTLPTSRPGVWERRERPPPMTEDDGDAGEKADIPMDHDYASASDPAVVDLALDDNMSLRDEILKLREHVEKLTMNQRFGIHRFAASDKDIRIVHFKIKILSSYTHPQVVSNLYEFLSSAEHKGRYFEERKKFTEYMIFILK